MEDEPLDQVPLPNWHPETLFASGRSVYTLDMGLRVCRIHASADNGLTDAEARHWASLLAQAPALLQFAAQIADFVDLEEEPFYKDLYLEGYAKEARRLVEAVTPKAKGRPFRPPLTAPANLPVKPLDHEVAP